MEPGGGMFIAGKGVEGYLGKKMRHAARRL